MPDLFNIGHTVLASGLSSDFKIDCDGLNYKERKALVYLARQILPDFGIVFGVPTGGVWLADELGFYAKPECPTVLVVDDVWTTGGSMQRFAEHLHATREYDIDNMEGLVLFARGSVPPELHVLFTLNPSLWGTNDRTQHNTKGPSA